MDKQIGKVRLKLAVYDRRMTSNTCIHLESFVVVDNIDVTAVIFVVMSDVFVVVVVVVFFLDGPFCRRHPVYRHGQCIRGRGRRRRRSCS